MGSMAVCCLGSTLAAGRRSTGLPTLEPNSDRTLTTSLNRELSLLHFVLRLSYSLSNPLLLILQSSFLLLLPLLVPVDSFLFFCESSRHPVRRSALDFIAVLALMPIGTKLGNHFGAVLACPQCVRAKRYTVLPKSWVHLRRSQRNRSQW